MGTLELDSKLTKWEVSNYQDSLNDLLDLESGLSDWEIGFLETLESTPMASWTIKQKNKLGDIWYKNFD